MSTFETWNVFAALEELHHDEMLHDASSPTKLSESAVAVLFCIMVADKLEW